MPSVGQPSRRREHLVEVEHRLAHAHEHGVVDGLDAPEVQRLVEDLRGGQVAPERHLPGRAERARQRTAGLRREAERAPPVAVAHQHRLDRMAVGRAEERLHRPVARLALRLDRERRERDLRLERIPQRRAGDSSSRRSPPRRARPTPTPVRHGTQARRARAASSREATGPCGHGSGSCENRPDGR